MAEPVKHPKFQLFKGGGGKAFFRLTAKNGQPILASQGYANKAGAKAGVESVQKNAPFDERYERKAAKNGQHYFVLKSTNGQVIGTSETYKTSSGCEKGIASVKANAPAAPVEDAIG